MNIKYKNIKNNKMTRRDFCYVCNLSVGDCASCCSRCGQSVHDECTEKITTYKEYKINYPDEDESDDFTKDDWYQNLTEEEKEEMKEEDWYSEFEFQCERCDIENEHILEIDNLKCENNKLRALIFCNHIDGMKEIVKKIYNYL